LTILFRLFCSIFRCANSITSVFASVANTDDAPSLAVARLAKPTPHPSSIIDFSLNIDCFVDSFSLSSSRVNSMPLFHTATVYVYDVKVYEYKV